MLRVIRALAVLCVGIALVIPTPTHATDHAARVRAVFIGNSYTRFNDLPRMVREISASVDGGPLVHTTRETHGGFDLRLHWRRRDLRSRIAHGRYDAVVIQGHSLAPISEPSQLAEYARRFASEAHSGGARLILFETWARHPRSTFYRESPELRDPEQMQERIEAVYAEIADELDVTVAPVGRAWQLAASEVPTAVLHRRDGTHPEVAGSYLSALVLYGTLAERDPREATWRPWRMSPRQAARIRRVAAASLASRPR